ncbi:hypothetical protein Q2T42_15010 [Leptolyngbya boryana CZ1]|uniref:Uncharacterized protein n=1 Tax=Leptolyngbya boryana CZ1 TaxID=3060204 RepID=A0AA96X1J3_LEPBY|nr:hypothetical protein [Leptolyngbya boryana]WNZ49131.1 hypothetical protein Q2T42_15010 [Leptolyngbya boryana CZ1]
MTTRLEVESAIKQLPESEVRDLAKWLQDYLDEMWDRQIETDLASGKLDRLIAQAEKDIAANNVRSKIQAEDLLTKPNSLNGKKKTGD